MSLQDNGEQRRNFTEPIEIAVPEAMQLPGRDRQRVDRAVGEAKRHDQIVGVALRPKRPVKIACLLGSLARSSDPQLAAGAMDVMVRRAVVAQTVFQAMRPFERVDTIRLVPPEISARAKGRVERAHADKEPLDAER